VLSTLQFGNRMISSAVCCAVAMVQASMAIFVQLSVEDNY
jgi:hypothetical protein